MSEPVDVLILSNGPGELTTWVKPVVQALRQQLGDRDQVRISVVLSPCTNASGQEAAIARSYPEVDRVQGAQHFFPFLLWGKTQENWDWHPRGVVLFLGGDQFFTVVIGKRLGYRTVIYAEWEARWHRWVDRFGVMKPEIAAKIDSSNADKFTVVGDLMVEAGDRSVFKASADDSAFSLLPRKTLIGLLPGSKPMKLTLGVPLDLAIADVLHQQRPDIQCVIPVAPALSLPALARYADPARNPTIQKLGWGSAELVMPSDERSLPVLKTPAGAEVLLWTGFPAYDLLTQCALCFTTIGANTAELGALGAPMIVMLPTQQLEVIKAWDGIPGLLVNLPLVGSSIAKWINQRALQRLGLLAWPNIWAQREIVPELVGSLKPDEVAQKGMHYLNNPALLEQMRRDLQSVRGEPGAARKLVQLVCEELEQTK